VPAPGTAGPTNFDGRLVYYAYENLDTGFVIRGTGRSGEDIAKQVFFPPNSRFLQFLFDPSTMTVSSGGFTTPGSGLSVQLPPIDFEPPYDEDYHDMVLLDPYEPPLGGDLDLDGLSDDIEFVLGSDPHKWSTC